MSTPTRLWPRPLLWDTHCPPHLALMGMALRWVHAGSKWRTRIVYAVLAWHLLGFFLLFIAGPALAAPNGEAPKPSPADTSMFGWTGVKDSSGIPISQYFIAVDHGNAISVLPGVGGDKKANIALAPILELEYGLFKIICQLALWIIGYGLSFKWLDFIAKPFTALGQAAENLTHNIGILTLTLTLAAAVAAFSIVRGRMSKAAYQIGSAMVITALMATIFAHPMAALVGSNGYLAKARDVGIQISSDLARATGALPASAAGSQPAISDLQTALADGFVRAPTQMLNFNANADANGCKGVWNTGIRSGDRNKLKNTIEKCGSSGKKMKYAADHLTGDRLASGAAILLLSAVLMLFGGYLVGKIVLAVVLALSQAIMLPIVGVLGVVAGGLQGMAFKMVCNLGLALIKIPLTVVYAGAYAALLRAMLQESSSNPIQALVFSTIMLVIATLAFRIIEAGFKNRGSAIVSFLNRGGGGSSELPRPTTSPLLRRGTAMAMQAGGAALGVPPTLTGLAVGTGRSMANPRRGVGRGGHVPDPDLEQFQQFQRHEQHQQQYAQYQRYRYHQHQQQHAADAAHQDQLSPPSSSSGGPPSTAPAPSHPGGPSPTPAAPRVTQVLQPAPPLHPIVAAGIGAMPQQIQPAASLPPAPTKAQQLPDSTQRRAASPTPPHSAVNVQTQRRSAPPTPPHLAKRSRAADIVNRTKPH